MLWVHLIVILALCQFLWLGILVGQARGRYGVNAPATTGHEMFERYYRVQMNTLELLVIFLPSLWIASLYWNPVWTSLAGAVYLAGRVVYLRAYVRDPAKRSLGFGLSILPVFALLLASLAGIVKSYFAAV